jgi:hypothetical protein
LGENVGIGKLVGFFEAFVSDPGDVKAGFAAVDRILRRERSSVVILNLKLC